MRCEEFRRLVQTDPDAATNAEMAAAAVHWIECAQCKLWVTDKTKHMSKQDEKKAIARGKASCRRRVAAGILGDPEVVDQIAAALDRRDKKAAP